MQTSRWLAGLIAVPSALALGDQSPLPQPLPADRYNKLLEDSPFAVATPAAPVEKAEEPWAANLFLGAAARINTNGQEEDWAVIKRKGELSGDFSLTPSEEGPDGIKLVRIQWADDSKEMTAVLSKGGKEATVLRNEADFATPAAPAAPPARAGQPGAPNPLANGVLNANPGVRKLPVPAGAPAIPRPSVLPTPANRAGAPAAAAQPGNTRQRIRVIEPGPRAR